MLIKLTIYSLTCFCKEFIIKTLTMKIINDNIEIRKGRR